MKKSPKYDDLMQPTLRVLAAHGGSATNAEIEESLIEMLGLEAEGIAPDRMSWARSYLKYSDFVDNPKSGVWILTEEGRTAANWSDEAVRKAVAESYRAYRAQKAAQEASGGFNGEADKATRVWTDALLEQLRTMQPDAFERLTQRLLRESGFVRVEVTGKSGDGGIDGSGVLRMNLISFQVLFQCKRYAGSVSAPTVRDFRGAMQGRADKGLIITTGTFTADARKEATRDGAPAIDLIDGEMFCELLKDRRLGVQVREIVSEEITVLPEFFTEM
ncbi:MAG: restriction endonuclease [Novosphingobium sp.]|jgi:restriction system protein|nr:restriction endonuclease [Novosphingobium sp.]